MPPFLNHPSGAIVLPLRLADSILVFRADNYSQPLYIKYGDLLDAIKDQIQGGSSFITSVEDTDSIALSVLSGILSAALTETGVAPGEYGNSTHVPKITVDDKGRITNVELVAIAGSGSGTVTSVGAGTGMSFTTITASGNVSIDTSKVPYLSSGFSTGLLKWNGSSWVFDNSAYITSATLANYLTITAAAITYYPLTNPSGYLNATAAGALFYPLGSNPAGYLNATAAGALFYPLGSNPAGYLTSASISGLVPYTGATGNVGLGAFNLTAAKLFTTSAAALGTPATLFAVIDGGELKTRTPSQVLSDIGAASVTAVDLLGDGSDGNITMNGSATYAAFATLAGSTYTLIRDIYPQDLTVSSGVTLNTAGFHIMCRGAFTVNGTVGSVGNNGANGGAGTGSTAAGGVSLFTNQTTFYSSLNPVFTGTNATGGNGGTGANTSSAAVSKTVNTRYFGGVGGAGGNGNTATSGTATGLVLGGTVTLITGGQFNPLGAMYTLPQLLLQGNQTWNSAWPGAGGGVGQNLGGSIQGGGGGGGSCPFGLVIFCRTLTIGGSGLIRSNGGNGGNGGNASGGSGTGGGGGGGGGGGRVWITIQSALTYTLTSNQIQAKGGTGGTGGTGTGTQAGNLSYSGSNGGDGYVTLRILSAGTTTTYTGQV